MTMPDPKIDMSKTLDIPITMNSPKLLQVMAKLEKAVHELDTYLSIPLGEILGAGEDKPFDNSTLYWIILRNGAEIHVLYEKDRVEWLKITTPDGRETTVKKQ